MKRRIPTAAIVLFGVAAFASHAGASCGSSQRVSSDDSECMVSTHTNGTYSARNYCVHAIRIKVDVKNGSDKTRTVGAATILRNCQGQADSPCPDSAPMIGLLATSVSGTISTSWGRRIRSVTCCSDYADCDELDSEPSLEIWFPNRWNADTN